MEKISSTCIYCGVGCRLNYVVENNAVVKVEPVKGDVVSEGYPCLRGLTINEVTCKNRVLKPLIRENKDEDFEEVSWDVAYGFIHHHLKNLEGNEVLFIPSGKASNENAYVMQKFARAVLKSNNVDGCCSRLCHANTISALNEVFGINGSPGRIEEAGTRDLILIIGSNPASNYPVIFSKIVRAKAKGTKLIGVNSPLNETSRFCDINVQVKPDTQLVFINGLINELIRKGIPEDRKSIQGFEQLAEAVSEYTPERVLKICGIEKELFEKVVEMVYSSKAFGIMHGMGLTQSRNGFLNVVSLLNLLILKGGVLLSGRGEINVQGMGDVGGVPPGFLPSLVSRDRLEEAWGVELSEEAGLNMIQALYLNPVKAVLACDVNLALSLPDLESLHKRLKEMFIVLLHHHFNYTVNFANVVLPIAMLIEGNGTITNWERRIRLVRKVVEPPGEAKQAWIIFKELSKYFGCEKLFPYSDEKEIFREIVELVPAYRNVNVEEVYSGEDGWGAKKPVFTRYVPVHYEGVDYPVSKKYPYIMVAVRTPLLFLHNELTSLSETLMNANRKDIEACYMNPEDLKREGFSDGETIILSSPCGSLKVRVKADATVISGTIKMYIHSEKTPVNKLVPLNYTFNTFTPNYKSVAVGVRKDAS
ncbi:MAG: molybdopterin-dependent oxidoreductase [Candidatus Brockarchaeota archaeon]|nr:molybdopterin-dependent oxidoreductase [Candidatus Brockarchaeota archaeon]